MPPKKGKGKKAAAEPATTSKRSTRGSKAAAVAAPDETPLEEQPTDSPVEQAVEAEVVSNEPLQSQLPPSLGAVASAIETVLSPTKGSEPPAESMEEDTAPPASPPASLPDVEMTATGSVSVVPAPPAPSGLTMEQRQAKLDALRGRMVRCSIVLYSWFRLTIPLTYLHSVEFSSNLPLKQTKKILSANTNAK